uniref:Uncharacterized protein n=1 Tax=Micrurus corallinus TaxID=54390 RepID=A0A2D4FR40_MICCO
MDRFGQLGGEYPEAPGAESSRDAPLAWLLVATSMLLPGELDVLDSLLADTWYMTPSMQRRPLFLHRGCCPAWDLLPGEEWRLELDTRDLDTESLRAFQT